MPFKYPVPPNIRELLYDMLYSVGDNNAILKGTFRELGRTNSKAKSFCNKATTDQALHILSFFGMEWFIVIHDNSSRPRFIRDVLEKFKAEKDNTLMSRIREDKLYITTDRKLIKYLGVAAEYVDSEQYRRNIELQKAGYHVRKWTKRLNSETVANDLEDAASVDYLCKSAFSSFIAMKQTQMVEQDNVILLYLFPHKHEFVAGSTIIKKLIGVYKKSVISNGLRRLVESGLIEKHLDEAKPMYKITALGMINVTNSCQDILKSISFF